MNAILLDISDLPVVVFGTGTSIGGIDETDTMADEAIDYDSGEDMCVLTEDATGDAALPLSVLADRTFKTLRDALIAELDRRSVGGARDQRFDHADDESE